MATRAFGLGDKRLGTAIVTPLTDDPPRVDTADRLGDGPSPHPDR